VKDGGRQRKIGENFTNLKKVARGEGREEEENVHLEEGMSRSGGKREGGNCTDGKRLG
jgi:hypothetical protein